MSAWERLLISSVLQIEMLAKKVLKSPVEIIVGGRSVVSDTVEQHVEVWYETDRFNRLLQLLGQWYGLPLYHSLSCSLSFFDLLCFIVR